MPLTLMLKVVAQLVDKHDVADIDGVDVDATVDAAADATDDAAADAADDAVAVATSAIF